MKTQTTTSELKFKRNTYNHDLFESIIKAKCVASIERYHYPDRDEFHVYVQGLDQVYDEGFFPTLEIAKARAGWRYNLNGKSYLEEVKQRCLDITYTLQTDGLAYRLHPQSEWQGGDSFKTRSPHIANE